MEVIEPSKGNDISPRETNRSDESWHIESNRWIEAWEENKPDCYKYDEFHSQLRQTDNGLMAPTLKNANLKGLEQIAFEF